MKTILWNIIQNIPLLKKPSVKYCAVNKLLPALVTATPSDALRDLLFLPKSTHITQLNQDIFALIVNRFSRGYFIEIGANDGFTLSNTLYLEECFGWSGLLVEANPKYADSLSRRRKSTIINKAVSEISGTGNFVDGGLYGGLIDSLDKRHSKQFNLASTYAVSCITLQEMFDQANAPPVIDFISIDVEGGELPIIRQLVSNLRRIRCGCIEVNDREGDIVEIKRLLRTAGYIIVWEGQTRHDLYFTDPNLYLNEC